jgi:hypothetical protein
LCSQAPERDLLSGRKMAESSSLLATIATSSVIAGLISAAGSYWLAARQARTNKEIEKIKGDTNREIEQMKAVSLEKSWARQKEYEQYQAIWQKFDRVQRIVKQSEEERKSKEWDASVGLSEPQDLQEVELVPPGFGQAMQEIDDEIEARRPFFHRSVYDKLKLFQQKYVGHRVDVKYTALARLGSREPFDHENEIEAVAAAIRQRIVPPGYD